MIASLVSCVNLQQTTLRGLDDLERRAAGSRIAFESEERIAQPLSTAMRIGNGLQRVQRPDRVATFREWRQYAGWLRPAEV